MSKKTRREIKEMFKAGSQPTGQNFSDFIDSITNSLDDGLTKPSEQYLPLRVESNGDEQNIFDFYDDDGIHCWRVNQYPTDSSVGGVSVQRAGLNIEDSNSETRLFIKQDNGDIGLGTVNPTAKLHVVQAGSDTDAFRVDDTDDDTTPFLLSGSGALNIRVNPEDYDESLSLNVSGPVRLVNTNSSTPSLEIYKGTDLTVDTDGDSIADKPEAALSVMKNGAVGIGTDAPDNGVLIKGNITLGCADDDIITVKGIIKSSNSSGGLAIEEDNLKLYSDSGPCELKISGNGSSHINAGLVVQANQEEANRRGLGMFMYDKTGQNEWFVGRPYSESDSIVVCRKESIEEHDVSSCSLDNSFLKISNTGNLGIGKTPAANSKLDVGGNINTDGSLVVSGDVEIKGKITVYEEMEVKAKVYQEGAAITLGDHDDDVVTIEGKLNSGHASDKLIIDDDLWVKNGLSVDADTTVLGSIGIGKTAGAGLKLDVAGNIEADGSIALQSGVSVNEFSSDTGLSDSSNNAIPTEKAVKTYVDTTANSLETYIDTSIDTKADELITKLAFPIGGIIIWSGAASNLPTGWALCDGEDGRPDLRDRFVVGAGSSYNPYDKSTLTDSASRSVSTHGGHSHSSSGLSVNYHTLSISEMPSHNHANGSYGYVLQYTGSNTSDGQDSSSGEPDVRHCAYMANSGGGQGHNHGISGSTASAGSHSHSIDVRPYYYALCYIIKVS